MINIECPSCHKKYSIPPEKVQNLTKVKLKCKSCNHSFVFDIPGDIKKVTAINNNKIASGIDDATMIGVRFSKEGDTSPYFFPEDCEMSLTYRVDNQEVKKILKKRLTVIGRIEGDIVIDDPLISRKHAAIEVKSSTMVELKDLASKNGTLHNDMKVTAVMLQSGDNIIIGSMKFVYSNEIKF